MGKVAVHGHRGARGCRPENTLAAFEYAIDAAADAIELDVVLTRDAVPVVMHDPRPHLALAELHRELPSVPTLRQVMALADRGSFLFNVEIKPFPDAAGIARLVAAVTAPWHARVMFQSFDFAILRELRRRAPRVRQAALFEKAGEDFVALARRARVAIVGPEFHLIQPEQVRAAHRAGLEVIAWTPNRPEQWAALIQAGVDALVTDYPAELIAFRDTGK